MTILPFPKIGAWPHDDMPPPDVEPIIPDDAPKSSDAGNGVLIILIVFLWTAMSFLSGCLFQAMR